MRHDLAQLSGKSGGGELDLLLKSNGPSLVVGGAWLELGETFKESQDRFRFNVL